MVGAAARNEILPVTLCPGDCCPYLQLDVKVEILEEGSGDAAAVGGWLNPQCHLDKSHFDASRFSKVEMSDKQTKKILTDYILVLVP